jgi:hypothetical protein
MRRLAIVFSAALAFGATTAFGLTWDFENAAQAKDWKAPNGTWEVGGGALKVTSKDAAQRTIAGNATWTDYTVETRIRIDEGNWAGVVFRAKSDMEFYVAYLNVPDNKSELWKHQAGALDKRAAINSNNPAVDVKIANGEWFDLKVVAKGDTFTFSINGKEQWTLKDADYPAGAVGVFSWQTLASWDSLSVTGAGIDPVTAVDPKAKLASTWATLKSR